MKDGIEIQIKLGMQETVDEFIYMAIEPFAETIIGRVSKEELKQILMRGKRKGRWIVWKDCEGKTRELTCSECGCKRHTWVNPNYCEDCGAKMEVEE